MNNLKTDQKENQIVKINSCYWKFPSRITIHETTKYHEIVEELDFSEQIIFDLCDTNAASSSFVGFLIYISKKIDSHGGELLLKPSKSMDRLLSLLELKDFFDYC